MHVKLQSKDYPVFYQPYISVLDENISLLDLLEQSLERFEQTLYDVAKEKQEYRYQKGKWTLKELVQHMIDAERVFVYRALRYSRKDQKDLPGFDENMYVSNYEINKRSYHSLLDEFCLIRRATLLMFQDFDESVLDMTGTSENNSISVRALGFICSGHIIHHLNIIEERYL